MGAIGDPTGSEVEILSAVRVAEVIGAPMGKAGRFTGGMRGKAKGGGERKKEQKRNEQGE